MKKGGPQPRHETWPVTVGLWAHQVEAMDAYATRTGTTRSDVMRKAIAAYQPLRDEMDGVLDRANGGG